jgi:hypothetical protein
MEIDRSVLIKLLESFVDASEVFQREALFYETLLRNVCKTQKLSDSEIDSLVARARETSMAKIREVCQSGYQVLLGKVPQIVDLLDSNRDEAFRLLKEWTPKGSIN